jgi:hypothetical protein
MKITFTVKGGRRLYAAPLALTGAATVLYADSGYLPHLSGAALFVAGVFYGRLLHDRDPRPGV